MRTGRSYVATAVALGIISLTGCASDSVESAPVAGDWGDPEKHPELGGAFNSLTAMSGTCTWNATTGAYTITIDDTAQTVVLGVRTVDSQLLVNGKVCSGTAGATTKLVKTVDIKAATGDAAAQAVVLDFLSGTFAPGVTGKPGIRWTSARPAWIRSLSAVLRRLMRSWSVTRVGRHAHRVQRRRVCRHRGQGCRGGPPDLQPRR